MTANRTATADEWKAMFDKLAGLVAAATNPDGMDLRAILAAMLEILDAAKPFIPAPTYAAQTTGLATAKAALERNARDWPAFLAAVADFLKMLAPLIASFIE